MARRATAVRVFTAWAQRTGRADADPGAGLGTPKAHKPLPPALSAGEARALLEAAAVRADDGSAVGLRDVAILELLYATGIRVGELCGLDVDDVDRGRRVVRVFGKGRKERTVPYGVPADRALGQLAGGGSPAAGRARRRARAVPRRPRAAHRPACRAHAWCTPARRRAGSARPRTARPAPHRGHPSARGRGRPAHRPGAARARLAGDHADLHPRHHATGCARRTGWRIRGREPVRRWSRSAEGAGHGTHQGRHRRPSRGSSRTGRRRPGSAGRGRSRPAAAPSAGRLAGSSGSTTRCSVPMRAPRATCCPTLTLALTGSYVVRIAAVVDHHDASPGERRGEGDRAGQRGPCTGWPARPTRSTPRWPAPSAAPAGRTRGDRGARGEWPDAVASRRRIGRAWAGGSSRSGRGEEQTGQCTHADTVPAVRGRDGVRPGPVDRRAGCGTCARYRLSWCRSARGCRTTASRTRTGVSTTPRPPDRLTAATRMG